MSKPSDIERVWGEPTLPLTKIREMGTREGLGLPFTLVVVSLAGSVHENYEVFVADNLATVTTSQGFNMTVGTAPTTNQLPQSPRGDLLIFLFGASQIKPLRFRIRIANLRRLEWFDESVRDWKEVP
jgi:hypothetical protein